MLKPQHPGRVLKELYINPLDLTITKAAQGLGVTRKTLSDIVNERAGISPEMALRLAKAFGGSAQSWLSMQRNYDLTQAQVRVDLSKVEVFYNSAMSV